MKIAPDKQLKPTGGTKTADALRGREIDSPEVVFDIEQDVAPYFEEIKAKIKELEKQPANIDAAIEMALELVILFPERRTELALSESCATRIRKKISNQTGASPQIFLEHAVQFITFFPDHDHSMLSSPSFDQLKERTQELVGKFPTIGLPMASNLAILYPERRAEIQKIVDFEEAKKTVDENRDEDWHNFSTFARHILIIYPGRRSDLDIGSEQLVAMRKKMEQWGSQKWWSVFLVSATNLATLSAERVDITADHQLNFITAKPETDLSKPDLPIRPVT